VRLLIASIIVARSVGRSTISSDKVIGRGPRARHCGKAKLAANQPREDIVEPGDDIKSM